ncbi:MAG: GDP-L-fucose synthase [Sulfuriferula sp.]|nr:GDP-L-fucose synthase [Sulfuriferula sp.]
MNFHEKIYIAGHSGLVGSALVRNLRAQGYINLVTRTHAEMDLTDYAEVEDFFRMNRPAYVFLAAAKVGSGLANNTYPADFIANNLAIQTNIIKAAHQYGALRLLFLGSSCIYPRDCLQPMKEDYLLTGALEPTNRPYAVAKIAGVEMCWAFNRQFSTQYLAVLPCNLYGPNDNYDLNSSHVIPALIRRFNQALQTQSPTVSVWGTGTPRREFMSSNDMADACVFLMNLPDAQFQPLLAAERNDGIPPVINVGVGTDISIAELASRIAALMGYTGQIIYDTSKPDGPSRKLMDVSRLNQLGWRVKTTFAEGLVNVVKSYKCNDW